MPKIKLTKGELKRQRDSLQQFSHYLPTLQLKKQQLQMKIYEVRHALGKKENDLEVSRQRLNHWIGLLADPDLNKVEVSAGKPLEEDALAWLLKLLSPQRVHLLAMNVAGAELPVLKKVDFPKIKYDYYSSPFWLDYGVAKLRDYISLLVEIRILNRQIELLGNELRVTTQRVNLFEKVKIPECLENIRKIRIALGDLQANAVGISKVVKKKIEAACQLESALV